MGGGPIVVGHRGSQGDGEGSRERPYGSEGGSRSLGMKGGGGWGGPTVLGLGPEVPGGPTAILGGGPRIPPHPHPPPAGPALLRLRLHGRLHLRDGDKGERWGGRGGRVGVGGVRGGLRGGGGSGPPLPLPLPPHPSPPPDGGFGAGPSPRCLFPRPVEHSGLHCGQRSVGGLRLHVSPGGTAGGSPCPPLTPHYSPSPPPNPALCVSSLCCPSSVLCCPSPLWGPHRGWGGGGVAAIGLSWGGVEGGWGGGRWESPPEKAEGPQGEDGDRKGGRPHVAERPHRRWVPQRHSLGDPKVIHWVPQSHGVTPKSLSDPKGIHWVPQSHWVSPMSLGVPKVTE